MKIFGQVLDTNDEPMALANITIVTGAEANKMGTTADYDGKFTLEDETILPDSRFKISYIGYTPQEFNTNELQGKKVKLKDNTEALQEVVIYNGSKPSKSNTKAQSSKQKFIQHLQDHKFIYATLGGLVGIILIVRALKK